jgi:hypothetical protein
LHTTYVDIKKPFLTSGIFRLAKEILPVIGFSNVRASCLAGFQIKKRSFTLRITASREAIIFFTVRAAPPNDFAGQVFLFSFVMDPAKNRLKLLALLRFASDVELLMMYKCCRL